MSLILFAKNWLRFRIFQTQVNERGQIFTKELMIFYGFVVIQLFKASLRSLLSDSGQIFLDNHFGLFFVSNHDL